MPTSRVMVIGPMTSGKTTVADHLVKNYGFQKFTLAATLKEIVADIELGFPTDEIIKKRILKHVKLSNDEFNNMRAAIDMTANIEHEVPKPRKRLQFLGTEGGRRMVRDTLWIDIVKAQIKYKGKYTIDDVRFINEYTAFLEMSFTPIKLRITGETQDKRIKILYGNYDPKILEHPSETELKQISVDLKFSINNDGSLDHLFHYVDLILNL